MIINESDKELLRSYGFDEKYFTEEDVNEVLLEVNQVLMRYGFDETWNITDEGRAIERVYDRIYEAN